jgi:hypothetical protein
MESANISLYHQPNSWDDRDWKFWTLYIRKYLRSLRLLVMRSLKSKAGFPKIGIPF